MSAWGRCPGGIPSPEGTLEAPTAQPPPAALRLAERWAEFTKAFSIYPETNARVRSALDGLLAALEEVLAASESGSIEICFPRGAITFGAESLDLVSGTPLAWLHDRIHHSALAGVRFGAGVGEEALFAFTRRLLELFSRPGRAGDFAALWPSTYEGLELLDRRFRGAFLDEEKRDEAKPRTWGDAGGVAIDTSRDDQLVDDLLADATVREEMGRLRERVKGVTRDGEDTIAVDLIGRIVRQLPADVMRDPEQIRMVAVTAMQRLGLELADLDASGGARLPQDLEMSQLLFEASQGLLGRVDENPDHHLPELGEVLGEVHPAVVEAGMLRQRRDAAIEDTAEEFLADLEVLPPPWDEELAAGTVGRVDEELGVHLHVLANADRPENAAVESRTVRSLRRLLPRPGSAEFALLLQYVDPPTEARDAAWAARRARVERALRRAEIPARLRKGGQLAADDAVVHFPRRFGLYLDTLDPKDGVDRAELEGVAERLGHERIAGAATDLLEDEDLLEASRIERLLAAPRRPLLPFVKLVLEHGDANAKLRAREALKTIYAKDPVGSLLVLDGGHTTLPTWYVEALADGAFDGIAGDALRRKVAKELVRYVSTPDDRGATSARRLQAIAHLGHFSTPEANLALTDLVEARRYVLFPREPKAVRAAAKKALRTAALRRRIDHVS